MKLVVGLGNPGNQYADTRHNLAWMVLDRVADRAGQGRAWPRSRRVVRAGDPRRRPGARARQAPDVHERLRARGPPAAAELSRAARRPAGRRGRLRAPVRQAAVPRGRVARRPQRPALDHRGPQQREVQPPPGRASASPAAAPSTTSSAGSPPTRPPACRSSSMPPPRRSRRGSARGRRRRPTGSTPGTSRRPPRATPRTTPTGQLQARWAALPIPNGVRRTKTGWRRILPGGDGEDRGKAGRT